MTILHTITQPTFALLLKKGSVGVMPTDTVYGLVAAAANRAAAQRLYALKQREQKPGTLIAATPEQLIGLGLDQATVQAVRHVWPAPISVVVPTGSHLRYLDQGKGDVAVRIPANPALRKLLQKTGPLITSSANQPGQPPATNLQEAQAYFGDAVDFYVDAGRVVGEPSTVVRFANGQFEILRQGAGVVNKPGA